MADSDDDQLHEVSDAELESMISADKGDDDSTELTSLGSQDPDDILSFEDDDMAPNYPSPPSVLDGDDDSDDNLVYEEDEEDDDDEDEEDSDYEESECEYQSDYSAGSLSKLTFGEKVNYVATLFNIGLSLIIYSNLK